MTRIVKHRFETIHEAEAFLAGVEWVNDSDIVHTTTTDYGRTLEFVDEKGEGKYDFDHRRVSQRPDHDVSDCISAPPHGYHACACNCHALEPEART